MIDYAKKMANRTKKLSTSAIREILKATQNPEIISLAGGLPAPETFPITSLSALCQSAVSKYGAQVLQYGITEGFLPLRQALVPILQSRGLKKVTAQEIFISTGAQNAIDAAAKILLNKNDLVAIESPTYLGSIKTFKSYEAKFVPIPMDKNGIIPEEFEQILKTQKIKVTYLVPTFQNPTGRTLSLERRKQIAHIIQKYEALIIEDDPYYELRYSGKPIPPIQTFAPDHVIYIGSLSKVFSPGSRLGYYIAPQQLAETMTSVRQGVDVHANSLTQAIACEFITSGKMKKQLPKTLKLYSNRVDTMLTALKQHLPKQYTFSKPKGGMFVWVEGPPEFDAQAFYAQAIAQKVAIVPGASFFTNNSGKNTFRLNFTTVTEKNIKKAIKILGELLQ